MNDFQARGGRRGRGYGARRGQDWAALDRRNRPSTTSDERSEISSWFLGNLVDGWFVDEPVITVDDYEILVVGTLAALEVGKLDEKARLVATQARIERFREDTRERRMTIAQDAQTRFGRHVSWGVSLNGEVRHFTTANVPVMTRLRMQQRRTLDTLVEAGVARSRSEALAWCVDLVGQHEQEWIDALRAALDTVAQAREHGPGATKSD